MWSKIKSELRAIGVVFLVSFLTCSVVAIISMLIVVPLVKWWRFGVLYFSVSRSELFKLSEFVLVLSMGMALSIWLLSKIDKRKQN